MQSFEGVKFVVARWWGVQQEGKAKRGVWRTSGGTSSECFEINYRKLASAKEVKTFLALKKKMCAGGAYIYVPIYIYISTYI
jgi:hypothetical protein